MRRRLLMAIADKKWWLPYSFEYLYARLVPADIAVQNLWDEVWERGTFDSSTGEKTDSTLRIRTANYIRIIPGCTYRCISPVNISYICAYGFDYRFLGTITHDSKIFTVPNNCLFIRMSWGSSASPITEYNNDIRLSLYSSMSVYYGPHKIKHVLDHGRLLKVRGSSEVKNQLLDYTQVLPTGSSKNGVTITNNNDGTYTITGTTSVNANSYFDLLNDLPLGHTYLVFGAESYNAGIGGSTGSYNLFCRYTNAGVSFNKQYGSNPIVIKPASTTYPSWQLQIQFGNSSGNITFNDTLRPQVIDLTKEYPFDTPERIDDPRIQRLLMDYHEFSAGEIEDSVIDTIACSGSRLPEGYQELEYVANKYNDYIDTGWKPDYSKKFRVEAVVMPMQEINSTSSRLAILSTYNGSATDPTLSLECFEDNLFRFYSIDTSIEDRAVAGVVVKEKNTLIASYDFGNSFIQANNTVRNFSAPYSATCTNNAYIFKDVVLRSIFKCFRLYSVKIYENDILIRDFVPCQRLSDMKAGLYDLANDVFYLSATNTSLLKGPTVINDIDHIALPQPLTLAGVNTAQDSFEITDTHYVFTRNIWYGSMGELTYSYNANGVFISDRSSWVWPNAIVNCKNALCTKYIFNGDANSSTAAAMSGALSDGQVCCYNNADNQNKFVIKDSSAGTDPSVFKTAMSGVPFYYQLATPQVINIPRKHLHCVDLGSLTYSKLTLSNVTFFRASIQNKKAGLQNQWVSDYLTVESVLTLNKSINGSSNTDNVSIRDDDLKNLTEEEFRQHMRGKYLWFETQNEVTDFVDVFASQPGSILTARAARLPLAYQEVEYIQSTGTQYIDTSVAGTNIGKIISVYKVNTYVYDSYIYGSGQTNYNRIYMGMNDHGWLIGFGGYTNFGTTDNNKHFLTQDLPNKKWCFDGTSYTYTGSNLSASSVSLTIFARHHSTGDILNFSNVSIYSLKVYDLNGVLIRHFVPCYRKSDNIIGLYDIVNNVFYTNSGTGTFLKGENVTSPPSPVLPCVDMEFLCK